MESPAENSDSEWDEEDAPSLADLPLAFDQSSPEYFQEKPPSISPWKYVLKDCGALKTSETYDFEFSSVNSTPKSQKNQYSDEFCHADKLFFKGQLLPLSYHQRAGEYSSDSQNSNSSSGSSSQSSNGKSRVRFPQEDCENPKAAHEFPSVKERIKRRKRCRILRLICSCKDSSDVVAGAHRSKFKESTRIGRFNAVKE